ncbi:EAL domain-containing response regulator [Larsenimonas rhizosphaerae]|uniref:EAL domain-containing response regulator n=2 Tax=Larsenimonas rhizosphaerae TaxID=2944682 RepID=A0AA42CV85_9GAMM|nr:EAL domain-containing response regulator [Larsenimonas rhizosphaerae]MCX2524781.1 EAL domain-containing response regulator [Larsenimonas rhizosphaerae]
MTLNALVIDDDDEIRLLFQHLLARRNYQVTTAAGLDELIRSAHTADIDLVILDLSLGDFSGLDVLGYLQEQRLDPAVLLLSVSDETIAEDTLKFGQAQGFRMLGFMPKPVLPETLDRLTAPLDTTQRAVTPADVDRGLDANEFELYYQPKVRLSDHQPTGVEALLRWHDPERGLIPPARFIALAERHHRIVPLTWMVLAQVWQQHATWRRRGWILDIAINIPAVFLQQKNVLEELDALAMRHGLPPEGLTLEITETSAFECLQYARHVLSGLRERGYSLSLDDFGTGYSSMTQLYRLPYDELKIDRSFVSLCDSEHEAEAITRSIVELGQRLNLHLVAEGIESLAQYQFLERAGCELGQGFYIARPMPLAAMEQWYVDHTSDQRLISERL